MKAVDLQIERIPHAGPELPMASRRTTDWCYCMCNRHGVGSPELHAKLPTNISFIYPKDPPVCELPMLKIVGPSGIEHARSTSPRLCLAERLCGGTSDSRSQSVSCALCVQTKLVITEKKWSPPSSPEPSLTFDHEMPYEGQIDAFLECLLPLIWCRKLAIYTVASGLSAASSSRQTNHSSFAFQVQLLLSYPK